MKLRIREFVLMGLLLGCLANLSFGASGTNGVIGGETENQTSTLSRQADEFFQQGLSFEKNRGYELAIYQYQKAVDIIRPLRPRDAAVALMRMANCYQELRRYDDAEETFQDSIKIFELEHGSESREAANAIFILAGLYNAMGRYEKAEPLYLRTMSIIEKTQGVDNRDYGSILNTLAMLYQATARYAEAEPLFQQALAFIEKAAGPDDPAVGNSLNNLAMLYESTGRYAEAEPLMHRAQSITEKAFGPDHPAVATNLNNLAMLYESTGRYVEAEPLYQRALKINEESLGTDHPGIVTTLDNLAGLLVEIGRFSEAEPLYQRALAIKEKALGAEHPDVSITLNSLAMLFNKTGRYAEAEPLYQRALAIRENAFGADHPWVASTLHNLAFLYQETGRYAEAEPLYQRALAISEKGLGVDHLEVANPLDNLALLYMVTGRYAEAEPLFVRALVIREKILGTDHPTVALSLNNLASLYGKTARYAEQESLYERALSITEKTLGPDHPNVAGGLNNLALLYETTGRDIEAEPLLERALVISEEALGADHPDVADRLNNLAGLYVKIGRNAEAEPLYQRALAIATNYRNPKPLFLIRSNYSFFLADLDKPEAAIFFGKQSINTIQTMRQNIFGLGKETLRSFDATIEENYRRLAALLVVQGRLPEAERVLDLLKEQEHFQFVQRNTQVASTMGTAPLTSFEAQQQDILDAASASLADLETELRKLKDKGQLTVEEEVRWNELDSMWEQASADFIQALKQVVAAFNSARASEREGLRETGSLQDTLRELGGGAVALYTLVYKDSYVLILITPEYRRTYTVEISAADLARMITDFRKRLKNPKMDPRPLAEELYNIILPEQVRLDLTEANAVTLMWHLDGPLRYLPLAALYDGQHYLVEAYRNTLFTAASLLNLGNTAQSRWEGLGLGMSKARTIDSETFPSLDSVPAELVGIIRQGDETEGMIPGQRYLDESFTWEILQKSLQDKGSYTLVHIASHFSLEPGNSSRSFILTGSGDPISLEQISLKDNLFGGVDLLTLSACETAYSSGTDADGREIDGLSIIAQKKGANSIVATLWSVADTSTALLMREFYRLREEQGLPKAEALRLAQLAMLKGEIMNIPSGQSERGRTVRGKSSSGRKKFSADPEKPFAHPYYWAPFILMGNWK